jgi:hypothetical protein
VILNYLIFAAVLKKSCWTKKLLHFVSDTMTTELGAGQITNLIKKARTSKWIEDCEVYLEACFEKSTKSNIFGNKS